MIQSFIITGLLLIIREIGTIGTTGPNMIYHRQQHTVEVAGTRRCKYKHTVEMIATKLRK